MRLITGLLFMLISVLMIPTPAQAHTALESSNPEDGAKLTAVPERIVLSFTDQIGGPAEVGSEAVVVVDGKVANWPVKISGRTVTLSAPQGATGGSYEVNYRVISADGHPVSGSVKFQVDSASPTPATTPTPSANASPAASSTSTGSVLTSPLLLGVGVAAVAVIAAVLALRRGRNNAAEDE